MCSIFYQWSRYSRGRYHDWRRNLPEIRCDTVGYSTKSLLAPCSSLLFSVLCSLASASLKRDQQCRPSTSDPTPAPTEEPVPAPTNPPAPALPECSQDWKQCGGGKWSGPTCCQTYSSCIVRSEVKGTLVRPVSIKTLVSDGVVPPLNLCWHELADKDNRIAPLSMIVSRERFYNIPCPLTVELLIRPQYRSEKNKPPRLSLYRKNPCYP